MIYFHLHGMFNILSKFSFMCICTSTDISPLKSLFLAECAQLIVFFKILSVITISNDSKVTPAQIFFNISFRSSLSAKVPA